MPTRNANISEQMRCFDQDLEVFNLELFVCLSPQALFDKSKLKVAEASDSDRLISL
jgi:hypothetical protein